MRIIKYSAYGLAFWATLHVSWFCHRIKAIGVLAFCVEHVEGENLRGKCGNYFDVSEPPTKLMEPRQTKDHQRPEPSR